MMFTFMPALRRALRRHQGVPDRAPRVPMWRLLGGELIWAVREVVSAPWVLGGLVVGSVGTLVVLGTTAPGPVASPPWRVLVAIAVGLLLAAGGRALGARGDGAAPDAAGRRPVRPLTAATEVAAVVAAVVLLSWLLIWLVTLLV